MLISGRKIMATSLKSFALGMPTSPIGKSTVFVTIVAVGRSSARETAMRVAAGAIARKVLTGVTIHGGLVQMGAHKIDRARLDWGRSQ